MNDIDIIRLISGLLQFGVAWYALRLGRLFKSTVMGWLLFGGLTLLALVSLFLAVKPLDGGAQWGIKVDIICSLFSLLLLVGMTHFYSSLKNFLREETAARQALDKWESQVKEQWGELNKANERLRQTVTRLETETVVRLETEIAERKHAQENLEALLASSRQNEQILQRTVTALRTGMLEPPRVESPRVEHPHAEPPRAEPPRVEPPHAEAPDPAAKNSEPPPPAMPSNGEAPRPASVEADTKIITPPVLNAVGENGEHPPTIPLPHDRELRPAISQPGPAMKGQKPVPEPAKKNGEPLFITSRRSQSEPWDTAILFHDKTSRRKSTRMKRKKAAKTR